MYRQVIYRIILISTTILVHSCKEEQFGNKGNNVKQIDLRVFSEKGKSPLEIGFVKQHLCNIKDADSSLKVDLRYSSKNNFVGIDMYGELNHVYLQKEVAFKLKDAQTLLKAIDSTLSILVFDGVRPLHIQQKMWDTLKMPIHEKTKFLSNPKNHSLHNYGAAVDVSIVNKNGIELDMGTPYDYIGELAFPRLEAMFVQNGKLSQEQYNNRLLLRKVMREAGFTGINTEWWHFNSCTRQEAKERYELVN